MANFTTGNSQEIQDNLQAACCFNPCPPIRELEDNQFLAIVLWALANVSGITDWDEVNPEEVKSNAEDSWCTINMATLCSIPPDRLKALILFQLQAIQP